jgi:dipeptidyl aminopeptidase/acylaminoacyl peptidase
MGRLGSRIATFAAAWIGLCACACAALAPRVDSIERLTTKAGCEEFPSFHPNGRELIYDGTLDSGFGIFSLNLSTKQSTRLSQQASGVWDYWQDWDYAAALSPDGTRLIYLHDGANGTELRLMPVTGDADAPPLTVAEISDVEAIWESSTTVLAIDRARRVLSIDLSPVFSGNGNAKISVVTVLPERFNPYGIIRVDAQTLLFRVEHEDGNQTRWAVLRHLRGAPSLDELPLDSGTVAKLRFKGGLVSGDPRFFYQATGNTLSELSFGLRSRDGGALQAVQMGTSALGAGKVFQPAMGFAFSGDRKLMAYSSCYEYNVVSLFHADGTHEELTPRTPDARHESARLLDASTAILTERNASGRRLLLLDLKTKQMRELDPPVRGDHPSVSPDGKTIAFVDVTSEDGSSTGIALRSAGTQRHLTHGALDHSPRFTHDGLSVVFARGSTSYDGGALWIVSLDGKERPLGPSDVSAFATHPKRGEIIFHQRDTAQLYRLSLAGGAPEALSEERVSVQDLTFDASGERVLAVRSQHDLVEISKDGKAKLLVNTGYFGMQHADYLGSDYLVSSRVWEGDLWLARGHFP